MRKAQQISSDVRTLEEQIAQLEYEMQCSSDDSQECEEAEPIEETRRTIHIPNYKPPQMRVEENERRREEMMMELREESERKFRDECTFRPRINKQSAAMEVDREHLYRLKPEITQKIAPIPKYTSKESERMISKHTESFTERNFRKKPTKIQEEETKRERRRMTKEEQEEMVERLTRPKKPDSPVPIPMDSPIAIRRTKEMDKETFERLTRPRKEFNPPQETREHKKSNPERLSALYQKSIAHDKEKEEKLDLMRKWKEDNEMEECTFKPKLNRRRPPTPMKKPIKGMEEHIERMKHREPVKEKKKTVTSSVIVPRQFSFDRYPSNRYSSRDVNEEEIEDVLFEVERALTK